MIELRDLTPEKDPMGGAKKTGSKTPLPIRKLNERLANKPIGPGKLPQRPLPWRRLLVIVLSGIVIGNASVTLFLYAINRPELTAWTGRVPQSTPSAVNDLILGTVILVLCLLLLRKP